MQRETLTPEELTALTRSSTSRRIASARVAGNRPAASVAPDISKADTIFSELHRDFTAPLQDELTRLTGAVTSARLRDASLGTFGQFVFGQPVPTCCAVVRAEPSELEFFIAMRPSLLFTMLDRMLGCKQVEPVVDRPLSEIERRLAKLLFDGLLVKYAEVWQQALSLQLSVERIEHNLQRSPGCAGAMKTYLVRYDVEHLPETGLLEICIPWLPTQQIRERLAATFAHPIV